MLLSVLFGSKMMTYGHSLQRLHEENEKLFDRLTEKASLAASPQVCSIPFSLDLFECISIYRRETHAQPYKHIYVSLCSSYFTLFQVVLVVVVYNMVVIVFFFFFLFYTIWIPEKFGQIPTMKSFE